MNEKIEDAQSRLWSAITVWMKQLQEYPGWREWKRAHIGYTLRYGEDSSSQDVGVGDFELPPQLDAEHAVIMMYLELLSTVNALRDVEWYFRRFPFSGTPITREKHLRYCCEMYFGKFYQFKERLKNLSKAVQTAVPGNNLNFGGFIRAFEKEFRSEIKARNGVHHREAFDDVAISRVALLELLETSNSGSGRSQEYRSYYRKTENEWVSRIRRRADYLDKFVQAVAVALLRDCPFLLVNEQPSERNFEEK